MSLVPLRRPVLALHRTTAEVRNRFREGRQKCRSFLF